MTVDPAVFGSLVVFGGILGLFVLVGLGIVPAGASARLPETLAGQDPPRRLRWRSGDARG